MVPGNGMDMGTRDADASRAGNNEARAQVQCVQGREGKRMNDRDAEAEIATMALEDAERGDPDSQYVVAIGLSDGGDGFKRDEREALVWLRRAAAQGHADSLYYLGRLHDVGCSVRRDPAEAKRLYKLAAMHGHVQALLEMEAGNAKH